MKIKCDCSFAGIRLAKDGEYKMEFLAPLTELSNAISVVRGLNKRFKIALVVEGVKTNFDDVAIQRIGIDKDGETKVVFSVPYEQLTSTDLAYFGKCQQKVLKLYCKIEDSSSDEGEDDE